MHFIRRDIYRTRFTASCHNVNSSSKPTNYRFYEHVKQVQKFRQTWFFPYESTSNFDPCLTSTVGPRWKLYIRNYLSFFFFGIFVYFSNQKISNQKCLHANVKHITKTFQRIQLDSITFNNTTWVKAWCWISNTVAIHPANFISISYLDKYLIIFYLVYLYIYLYLLFIFIFMFYKYL